MTKYDSPQLIPENFSQKHTLTLVASHAIVLMVRFDRWDLIPDAWTGWLLIVAIVVFLIAEIHGAVTGKNNRVDTWSQVIWAFLDKGPVRAYAVLGWLGWLVSVLFEAAGATVTSPIENVALAECLLITGIGLWLLPHLLYRGKAG